MRIVHVIDYFHTDVGYQEFYLAATQAEGGHAVRVVTSRFRHGSVAAITADGAEGDRRLDQLGVEVVRLNGRQLGHDRAWLRGFSSAVSSFQPDVVHAHNAFAVTTLRVAHLCRRLGIPLLVDSHVQEPGTPGSSTTAGKFAYRGYRALFGRYLKSAVGDWVVVGPLERDFLSSRLGIVPEQLALISLGFDPDVFFFDPAARRRIRSRRDWGEDLVVAMTGKLHPAKRPDLVVQACERVAGSLPVRLVLAGAVGHDHLADLRRAAPKLDDRGAFEVLPMLGRHDLADLYRAVDVVVFPALMSISIFEAAATGVRVLLGRDASAEWTASLHAGILSVGAERLERHFAPEPDRERLAAEARARLSWPVVSERFVERYAALSKATGKGDAIGEPVPGHGGPIR